MAVRSNVGNIVTNGMQILSVSATNAAERFGRMSRFQTGVNNAYLNNLKAEGYSANDIGQAKARDTINWINADEKQEDNSVAEALEGEPTVNEASFIQTDQTQDVQTKTKNDINWVEIYKSMGLTRNTKGQFQKINKKEEDK